MESHCSLDGQDLDGQDRERYASSGYARYLLNVVDLPGTSVLPLATLIIDDATLLRYRLAARNDLITDSDTMLYPARGPDNRRINHLLLIIFTEY